jgi:hypothetical protein
MSRAVPWFLTAILCGSFATRSADAAETAWSGMVVAIGDAGALTVDGPSGAVLLAPVGIVVPARGDYLGRDACALIYSAAFHRDVLVRPEGDSGRPGIVAARIRLADGSDLGEQLVWAGLARCAPDARATDPRLDEDEAQARREGRGLWRSPIPLAALGDGKADAVGKQASPAAPIAEPAAGIARGPAPVAPAPMADTQRPPPQPGEKNLEVVSQVPIATPAPMPGAPPPSATPAVTPPSVAADAVPVSAPVSRKSATPAAREQAGTELDQQTMLDVDHLVGHQDP